VPEAAYRLERGVERRSADGVVSDVETPAGGVPFDVLLDGLLAVVDRGGPERFDEASLRRRSGGKRAGAERASERDDGLPTAPPPWTSTLCPARTAARSTSPSQAVMRTSGKDAASRIERFAGLGAIRSPSTAAKSASDPGTSPTPPVIP
jgi:hypothetical protein